MNQKISLFLVCACACLFGCADNDLADKDTVGFDGVIQKCYGFYGCFPIDYPWVSARRPVSWFPEPPEKVNPKYCLYTRRNPDACDPLRVERPDLYNSFYVPNAHAYFVVHGFVETGERDWIKEMTRELLKRSNANVIVIDWSGGSDPPYTQAVANIRLVGAMTAHMIRMMYLQEVGLRTERVHIIGHSLGAHLASYVGTFLREHGLRLGRITGLDPADPHFSHAEPSVRLDPSDAIFVDVVHTDANPFMSGGLGMFEPVGHVDFYPNGGRDQPGCNEAFMKYVGFEEGSFFKGVHKKIGCNHIRSHEYFTETINSPNKFLAVECDSWESYLSGDCFRCDHHHQHRRNLRNGTACARFGFHSINAFSARYNPNKYKKMGGDVVLSESPERRFVKMYLITGSTGPYYRNQYRVSWKISNSSHEIGKFRVKVAGNLGETKFMDLGQSTTYYDPNSEHKMVVGGRNVGKLESATMEWVYQTEILNPLTWRLMKPPISVTRVQIQSLETGESLNLCPKDDDQFLPGYPKKLVNCGA